MAYAVGQFWKLEKMSDKKPFLVSHIFFDVTDKYKLIPKFNFPYNNLI